MTTLELLPDPVYEAAAPPHLAKGELYGHVELSVGASPESIARYLGYLPLRESDQQSDEHFSAAV